MQLLIAISDKNLLSKTISAFENIEAVEGKLTLATFKHLKIDILETGNTPFETGYLMGKKLTTKKYHLVLISGLAGSINPEIEVGEIVNIINDKPAFIGMHDKETFKSIYQLKWLNPFESPHERGFFINKTSAYFNVFLPFRKVPAITTNILKGDFSLLELKQEKYKMDVETMNGLAYHYACLSEKANFYQIRAISYNLATENENENLALENLNNTLLDILNKL